MSRQLNDKLAKMKDAGAKAGDREAYRGSYMEGIGQGLSFDDAILHADQRFSELTAKGRKQLKDKSFGLPDQRRYPIHDVSHARNALARVAQNGTAEEKAKVGAAVKKKFPGIGKRP